MTSDTQCTIGRSVQAKGVGVHTGRPVTLELEPADVDRGIVFVRSDLEGRPALAVRPEAVDRDSLTRMTTLAGDDEGTELRVAMIEHLLAACFGMGVTNMTAVLDGPECPIFDGSAAPYVEMINTAGLARQERPARRWRLKRPVGLIRDLAEVIAIPADRPRFTFFGTFRHAGLPDQRATFDFKHDDFATTIAPARTFAFWEEIEPLREAGLIRGGSLDCAIVLRDGRPVQGSYRFENELAKHKLLDLMGDLAVLGRPVNAIVSARASGHAIHHEFVQLLGEELTDD